MVTFMALPEEGFVYFCGLYWGLPSLGKGETTNDENNSRWIYAATTAGHPNSCSQRSSTSFKIVHYTRQGASMVLMYGDTGRLQNYLAIVPSLEIT